TVDAEHLKLGPAIARETNNAPLVRREFVLGLVQQRVRRLAATLALRSCHLHRAPVQAENCFALDGRRAGLQKLPAKNGTLDRTMRAPKQGNWAVSHHRAPPHVEVVPLQWYFLL